MMIAKIGAAIGSIVVIITYFRKFVSFLKDFISIPETIKKIEAELKYNGGSTIKDSVNRIETRQMLQEQRLCFVLDSNLSIGVFETDSEGNCTRVSLGYSILAGKTQDECVGFGWVNNIYSEDRDKVFKEWSSSIQQTRPFSLKYRFNSSSGPIDVIGKATPIFSKGKIVSWIGVITKS